MGKKTGKTSQIFLSAMETVSGLTSFKDGKFVMEHKKKVARHCCHILLGRDSKGELCSEPRVMLDRDDVKGTVTCAVCGRTMPIPDINSDNLKVLKEAQGIIDSALVLFPWSDIKDKDAALALDVRNLLEQFIILYTSALDDITTAREAESDVTIKSHVSRM